MRATDRTFTRKSLLYCPGFSKLVRKFTVLIKIPVSGSSVFGFSVSGSSVSGSSVSGSLLVGGGEVIVSLVGIILWPEDVAIIEIVVFSKEIALLLPAVDIGVDVFGLVVISCLVDVYRVVICVECRDEDAPCRNKK